MSLRLGPEFSYEKFVGFDIVREIKKEVFGNEVIVRDDSVSQWNSKIGVLFAKQLRSLGIRMKIPGYRRLAFSRALHDRIEDAFASVPHNKFVLAVGHSTDDVNAYSLARTLASLSGALAPFARFRGDAGVLATAVYPDTLNKVQGLHVQYGKFVKMMMDWREEDENLDTVVFLPLKAGTGASSAASRLSQKMRPSVVFMQSPIGDQRKNMTDESVKSWVEQKVLMDSVACNGTVMGTSYELPYVFDGVNEFASRHGGLKVESRWLRAMGTKYEGFFPDSVNTSGLHPHTVGHPDGLSIWWIEKVCPH